MPSLSLSRSQTSPMPSESVSSWLGFFALGQLSKLSLTLSPSRSVLQTAPIGIAWVGFETSGQLSVPFGTPSPSTSALHASPRVELVSVLNWVEFGIEGQLSSAL